MSKIELLPLPEPFAGYGTNDVFSEAQLRARDRHIVELCASLCDEINTESGGGFESFADAIRSLLDEKKENE